MTAAGSAFSGSNELGQGSDTVIAMIAAEVLGLTVDDIEVTSGDTGLCPVDLGAYSSRQTLMTGNATKKAAEAIKSRFWIRFPNYLKCQSRHLNAGRQDLGGEKPGQDPTAAGHLSTGSSRV